MYFSTKSYLKSTHNHTAKHALERQGEQEKKKETKHRKARPEEKRTKNRDRG